MPLVCDFLSFNEIIATLGRLGNKFSFKRVPREVFAGGFPSATGIAAMLAYFEAHTYLGSDSCDAIVLANKVAGPTDAIEIPTVTKNRLGLDSERSWIVITEANEFIWPGPDLRPIPGRDASTIVYDPLPPRFFAHVRDKFLELCAAGVRMRRVT